MYFTESKKHSILGFERLNFMGHKISVYPQNFHENQTYLKFRHSVQKIINTLRDPNEELPSVTISLANKI
jgi:hypothetical protein